MNEAAEKSSDVAVPLDARRQFAGHAEPLDQGVPDGAQALLPPDTELRARLRDSTNERRRFGYPLLFILLRREREPSGFSRVHRLFARVLGS